MGANFAGLYTPKSRPTSVYKDNDANVLFVCNISHLYINVYNILYINESTCICAFIYIYTL